MRLVDAMNTHNSALITLAEMGCALSILPSDVETELGLWRARIADAEFVAGDPLALLGLVAIWKHRGEHWKRDDDRNLYQEIVDATFP